ncbi:6-bladed beta-propeller [Algoriphagus namhaensis]
MNPKFLILISVFLLSACAQPKSNDSQLVFSKAHIWEKTTELDYLHIQDLFSQSKYLVVEIPDNQNFYTADKVLSGDGKYFLGDVDLDNSILIVDEKGKFVNHIVTGGNGPGEIPRMEDFTYHPDRNTLLILTGWKIFEFSTSGEYIRDIRLPLNEVFHFINLGKGNTTWLYTSPPPYDEQLTKGFRLLSLINLENGKKVDSLLEIPKGRVASYSGTKELTFQNEQIVYAPTFGNSIFHIGLKEGNIRKEIFSSLTESNNLYGLNGLDEFFERLQNEGGTTFVDNFISIEDKRLFFLYKQGMYPKWGMFDTSTGNLTLAQNLRDRNLELPLLPFLDVQGSHVFRLLDDEYFNQILEQDQEGMFTAKIESIAPELLNKENKILLCIYEN